MTTLDEREALEADVALLEKQLEATKAKLKVPADHHNSIGDGSTSYSPSPSLHTLLLLADSALPLGSFAFSSGLESFLAHTKLERGLQQSQAQSQQALFSSFLTLSLQSLASTALPYVLAAYRDPLALEELDNDFDASTPCTVARRASIAQGRALLSVWERSFRSHFAHRTSTQTAAVLASFSTAMRSTASDLLPVNAHLAPLWGVITLLLNVDLHSSAYLFLFSHARTVISAAVRASVLGPYQAQAVLASTNLKEQIEELVSTHWQRSTANAGQSVPVLDLWVGRHEKLYSRIFNS